MKKCAKPAKKEPSSIGNIVKEASASASASASANAELNDSEDEVLYHIDIAQYIYLSLIRYYYNIL